MVQNEDRGSVFVVIPAFNEAPVIADVIKQIVEAGYHNVIVVDDGSSDNTATQATAAGAQCLQHEVNRGKGAATITGIEAALHLDADIIVTMDGDGQHSASDISRLVAPVATSTCDISLGSRLHGRDEMPFWRHWGNNAANVATGLAYRVWVRDSQSGMKAMNRTAARRLDDTASSYEFETAVLRDISRYNLRYMEVPISTIYTEHSTTKPHRQHAVNVLRTGYRLLMRHLQ